jgi:hypothetical protein
LTKEEDIVEEEQKKLDQMLISSTSAICGLIVRLIVPMANTLLKLNKILKEEQLFNRNSWALFYLFTFVILIV